VKLSSPKPYESKWLLEWQSSKVFEADPDENRPKFFICVPYSYQNGPLHLGHGFTFTRGDAVARFRRMQGYNVLFPWSWHWTGEAVAGTSERLRRGDEAVVRMLRDIDGVPESLIPRFLNPAFICAYYTAENRQVVKLMGWSVDWRREFYTTDLHPYYSKFITWQYEMLRKRGRVVKGSHPVVWCPSCQSATGDHDRLSGEGVSPEEFSLVYFQADGVMLAAATLRPETIFGATNIWLNPDAVYVLADVDGVRLLVSRRAAEKLKEQKHTLEVKSEARGSELMGKSCTVPLTGRSIPILPASFVNPNLGTGVVYSVPAHAPYDYAALKDLQNAPSPETYGLGRDALTAIKPISMISVEGFGEFPAAETVEALGIASQSDPRLEEATKQVYMKEFSSGVLKENCGRFSGMTVREAREAVRAALTEAGLGDVMYDLTEKVVCRSGDECLVKVVEDQWFLSYRDPEWKEKVRRNIAGMSIYPAEARQWFLHVVDWLKEWACTRKTGLGTPLPWDPTWIVETLSDSTVYPLLYTISKHLNADPGLAGRLGTEVFEYIFHGENSADDLSRRTGIRPELLEEMRREFLYWFPVDMRISAKELVPNHLTFYLFHNTALFDEELWPRGIGVNGMISIEGAKMSKSRGNFIPLKAAVSRFGADATRCALLLGAEDLDDPDWREKNVIDVENELQSFLSIVRTAAAGSNGVSPTDAWLTSQLQLRIARITDAMERLKTRTAVSEALYGMLNDLRWHMRRSGGLMTAAGLSFIKTWTKLLSPFAPFVAEEAWSILGGEGLVSVAQWPSFDQQQVDGVALMREEMVRSVLEDVRAIVKVMERRPRTVSLFVPAAWKAELAKSLLGHVGNETGDVREAVREAVASFPDRKKQAADFTPKIIAALRKPWQLASQLAAEAGNTGPEEMLRGCIDSELDICHGAADLLRKEFEAEVQVIREEEAEVDPLGKSRNALPLRPGIYIE